MPSAKAKSPRKDWYSISVDTLRGWGFLLFSVLVLAGGYLGYRSWEQRALEREAAQVIEEVGQLIQRAQGEASGTSKSDYDAAFQSFEEARTEFRAAAYRSALASARRSKNVLLSLLDLDAREEPGAAAQAHFITIQGEVEFRRQEGGDWEEAKSRTPLGVGDYVRTTGNGSAEIMFADRSLYTVRPNTQFIVSAPGNGAGGADQTIEMEYGWIHLNTTAHPNNVKTPGAEARVQHDSEAFVTFDKASKKGRYGALRGGMEVESKGGLKRAVEKLQQVVQTGDLLSAPLAMPDRPQPLEPADNLEVDPAKVQRLVLAWQPVPGVSRYALQVSRSHLFVDNIVDVENRAKTRATLGIRGEGTFQWRVAAYGKDGTEGPWSPARRFRIASLRTGGGDKSADPPTLDLEDVKSYGSIFIVHGKSDPGVRIEVNGEAVKVSADGSFQKTVQLTKEGWSFIEIRARDGWGNETVRRHRIFVENP